MRDGFIKEDTCKRFGLYHILFCHLEALVQRYMQNDISISLLVGILFGLFYWNLVNE